jgi:translation initiation factor IF-3
MRRSKFDKRPRQTGPRTNGSIRVAEVRVVLADGTQLGIMSSSEARTKAEELELDLVEISPNVKPPVCKIIDYGKYLYEEKKRKSEARKNQTKVELKKIKLSPKTDVHDIGFKAKNARKFLEQGNKVQFDVRFRGRENAHPETGRRILDKMMAELVDIAKLERAARYENRVMTMMISPK